MASTYSTSLRLELMATGDQSGTWGDTTNTNLGTLLEQAITGVLSVAQGDVANLTLTTVNGGTDQARNAVVNITGALLAQRNVVVQTANKLYLFKNATTGGFAINVKTAAGTGVLVANGASRLVYSDGTNVVDGQFGPLLPSSDDGGALGSATIEWSDLFLASGGVLNWANGNVTLTHSSALLTSNATIASSGSSVGYVAFQAISTEAAAAAGPIIDLYRNSASPAASDVLGRLQFNGQNSTPAKKEYASIETSVIDATAASEDASMDHYAIVAGTRTRIISVGPNLDLAAVGQIQFPATQNSSAGANVLDDYEEGSFTATLTGCTTSPTMTIKYTKVGRNVTLAPVGNSGLTGTSNATSKTLTGVPAALFPADITMTAPFSGQDSGGTFAYGFTYIDASGVINLLRTAGGSSWTNSGTFSVYPCAFSYLATA